jgi:hypothetical protein
MVAGTQRLEGGGALRFRFEAKKNGPYLPQTSDLYPPTAEGFSSNLKPGTVNPEPLNL